MKKILGIRREDKNEWERRVPLIPDDVADLRDTYGVKTIVQPSPIRVFSDEEYVKAGAVVKEDMSEAEVIVAVKEVPTALLEKGKTYVYFSHTIKGQSYNMDMLRRLMDLECNLVDYERIVNEKNMRLIFFGKYAGLAGMIETFYAFGQKMRLQGISNPFEKIKQAYEYGTLECAKEEIKKISDDVASNGLPAELCPLVVGFAGYGNVSKGAQDIFDLFPHKTVPAGQLKNSINEIASDRHNLYKVEFKEEDMVKPNSGAFELQDYYNNPEKYESIFEGYLSNLSMLVNCIYWTEKYPRLVTKDFLKRNPDLGLKVIGDISCDIEGSIEITKDATMPDSPCFTYYPDDNNFDDVIQKDGITVMAVDNLPCEFPKEASEDFSTVLKEYVNEMVTADFHDEFNTLKLPYPIKRALILHNGQLTDEYTYMHKFL